MVIWVIDQMNVSIIPTISCHLGGGFFNIFSQLHTPSSVQSAHRFGSLLVSILNICQSQAAAPQRRQIVPETCGRRKLVPALRGESAQYNLSDGERSGGV